MPFTCVHCGAHNRDGNIYCQSCGTPLSAPPPRVAAAVAPPPIASPLPIPGPPPGPLPGRLPGPPPGPPPAFAPPAVGGGYHSPYYAPPPGVRAPVHRTHWTMIIAGVIALVVVMAGAGTALAVLGSRGSPSTTTTAITSDLPSPSPGVSQGPVGVPSSSSSAGIASTNGFTVPVPAGWTVQRKDTESILLYDPDITGSVTVSSGASSPAQTAQDNKNTVDSFFRGQAPDVRNCPNTSVTSSTFNGANGIAWTLCFTLTTAGHSTPATASLFAGANASGSVNYIVMVVTRDGNLPTYLITARPVLQGVHWKLS
jgi:hypothetical protein